MTGEREGQRVRFRTPRDSLGSPSGKLGAGLLLFVFALVAYGATLDPWGPRSFPCYAACSSLPPFTNLFHPFGTGPTGEDVFSEIAHGAGSDLLVGFLATGIALLVGALVGALAGYRRGALHDLLLSFTQIVLLVPSFVIVVWFYGINGDTNLFTSVSSTASLAVILGAFSWPPIALAVRNAVMTLREEEFVLASRALGAGGRRVVFRHVIPNVVAPMLSVTGIVFGVNITLEALMVFVGAVPSLEHQMLVTTWGLLLQQGLNLLPGYWWVTFFPGLMIVITVLGFNLLVDSVSEAFSPNLRPGRRRAVVRPEARGAEPVKGRFGRAMAVTVIAVVLVAGLGGAYFLGAFSPKKAADVASTGAVCSISGVDCTITLSNSGNANGSLGYAGGVTYMGGAVESECQPGLTLAPGSVVSDSCTAAVSTWTLSPTQSPTPGTPFKGNLTLADGTPVPFSGQFQA